MIEVKLSIHQLAEVPKIIKNRYDIKRKHNVIDRAVDKSRNGSELDKDGIHAELAIEDLFGVPMQRQPSLSGDPGWDFIIGGMTIDVKGTKHQNGNLIYKNLFQFKADRAIFCIINLPIIKVIGYVDKEIFLKKAVLTDLGHGLTYKLNKYELTDIYFMEKFFAKKYRKRETYEKTMRHVPNVPG
jgi:hypothetical protein